MNIVKGLNRITIVVATITNIPGFIGGWEIYYKQYGTVIKISAQDILNSNIPSIKAIRKKYPGYNDISDSQLAKALHKKFYYKMSFKKFSELFLNAEERPPSSPPILAPERRTKKQTAEEFLNSFNEEHIVWDDEVDQAIWDVLEGKYKARVRVLPPKEWECAIAGVIGSSVTFFVVLFGLRGTIRIFAWIVAGFKNDEKE